MLATVWMRCLKLKSISYYVIV